MRRSVREDLAPAEIMDTSVATTLLQREAATAVVYRHIKNEDAALEVLAALGLDSDDNIILVG